MFRPGSLCAVHLGKKQLMRLIWQRRLPCPCIGKVSSVMHTVRGGGVFPPPPEIVFSADKSKKARVSLRAARAPGRAAFLSTAAAASYFETADFEEKNGWGLNEEQLAVAEVEKANVRVVAGPGSGKTRVLTHRIAHMINELNVPPRSILCVTFTKRAAQELSERLNTLLDVNVSSQLTVGTFHSVCARILRQSAQISDYNLNRNFIIYDENNSEQIVKRILEEALDSFDAMNASIGRECFTGDADFENLSAQNLDENVTQRSQSAIWEDLVRYKFLTDNAPARLQLLQFLECHIKRRPEQKKRPVTSDAVQDLLHLIGTARLHNVEEFIARKSRRTLHPNRNSINAFAIKMSEIYELELRRCNAADFADLLYLVVRLLHRYPHILKVYRDIWKHVLVDEFQDIDGIQYEFLRLLSIRNASLFVVGDTDQAIYGWRGANSSVMEKALDRDFCEIITLQEIRYVLSYLHLVSNQENQMALESIIDVPPRGIGQQTLAQIKQWASGKNLTLPRALQIIHGEATSHKELNITPEERKSLLQFWQLIEGLRSLSHSETVGRTMEAVIERTDFKNYVKKLDNSKKACIERLHRLSVLQTIADSSVYNYGTGQSALLTFLQEISFVSDQKNEMGKNGKDFVKLMTLHAAKGLEFDCVFITGLQEDLLPLSGQNVSEEHRLFYVGVTRAIQRLYITFSASNIIGGEKLEAKPSRFLNDIVNSEMKHILGEELEAKPSRFHKDIFNSKIKHI